MLEGRGSGSSDGRDTRGTDVDEPTVRLDVGGLRRGRGDRTDRSSRTDRAGRAGRGSGRPSGPGGRGGRGGSGRSGGSRGGAATGRREFRRRRQAARLHKWRLVLALVLLVALVGAGGWLAYASPYLLVDGESVSGARQVPVTRIEAAARVPVGTPLARVDLDAVRARVESIPAVRSVVVTRSWPHTVHIAVTERTPVAVVDQGNGLRAVDASGALFGAYRQRPAGLPLVTTKVGTGRDALAEGARVVASLAPGIARRVTTTDVASVDSITLVLKDGRTVVWGSAEQSATKAQVVEAMLRSVPAAVRQIDVSVPGRPTTR